MDLYKGITNGVMIQIVQYLHWDQILSLDTV
mgnify:CR=1 FL=1